MSEQKQNPDIATDLVHAGERTGAPEGQATSTPIYASSTYTYESMEEIDQVFGGEKSGFIYTRYGNPTVASLEKVMRTIEDGAVACAYASGMAAVHAALFACELSDGATVLASQDLYGATTNLLLNVFGAFGIKPGFADFSNLDAVRVKAIETKPRAIIVETISNPLLKVCDIDVCAEIAHAVGARLIIDNTFASPYLCQPLKHGADMVVHSATKYLGGHADAMGGVVVSRDEMDAQSLIGIMKLVGGVLSPWEAHEILRGLKTLAVRMERHCDNARQVAERLRNHPSVGRVLYPAFGPGQDVLRRIVREPYGGGLIAIELKNGTKDAAFRFMDALKLCVRSTSLGDVFTSVLHPATASHRDLAPARRKDWGITDGLVRISVGIENVTDIVADIEQALASSEVATEAQSHRA
jgi:cystathionine beta-lyase/cystathionine gamma-synthase